ncbi:hypothetical protein HIM_05355 [Hirsutella minnesotensis 3608]|uniref:Major facilitator superfamily (MFS) profile domain-containing protein n=1 Tax=Hirsutella minnesotensis 3608 TaxID=1043627 RepID=A0A0F7ZKE1_9HYPO|nr:hypothetical protein HIM_05355 [Hirsutella minnesotensis 3608]
MASSSATAEYNDSETADSKPALLLREGTASSDGGASIGSTEPRPRLHAKTFMAVGAVCLIYFAQLVNLVGAGAQGQTIAAHFQSPDKVLWLSAPITILTVVLGPIVSQAADYWGRKWFLVCLTATGIIGSIIVSQARTMNQVIAGFCVVGVSFGVQPLLHTVTSEVLPRRWRAWGQAADMVSNGFGTIWGLLLGGAFNRTNDPASEGFRRYWLMAMAWYAAAVILCVVGYNPPETPLQREYRGRFMDKLRKLDWIGYFLLAAGLVLFCVGLSWSQNPYPWTDARVSAIFAVGLGLALLLVGYETWIKKDGMFHHGLFSGNRNFSISLFCVFAEGVAFFAANIYFAFEVSVLYEKDALLVGTRYSIMLICSMIGAVLTGLYCDITRKLRWVTVLAFLIFVSFFACMSTANRETNNAVWGYPVLLGFALGMTLTTLVTAAQLSIPPQLISVASGLIISVRSLGGTIGIAIYNALFTSQMRHMPENIANAVLPLGLNQDSLKPLVGALSSHNETALAAVPGASREIIEAASGALLDTYILAFRYVWIAAACFVSIAAIASVFLFDPKEEFNMKVDAPIEMKENLYNH